MAAQLIKHNNIVMAVCTINTHANISIWVIFKYLIPTALLAAVENTQRCRAPRLLLTVEALVGNLQLGTFKNKIKTLSVKCAALGL